MPSQTRDRRKAERLGDCQTAWFSVLERARRTGDRELAARAEAELKRLGVRIVFQQEQAPEHVA